jgi:micrococcal nuclease
MAVVVAVALVALLRWWNPGFHGPPESLEPAVYRVERVVDGDTLLLSNRARVRLIGADTPETVRPDYPPELWGREATEFTEAFVAGGEVRLQFDGPRRDKYDRFLAHVWVGDRSLSEELIRAGLARATTGFRYSASMKSRFRRAEAEARAARRGIWSQ